MKVLNFLFVVIVTTLLVGTLLFSEEDTWKGPGIEGIAWRNGKVGIGTSSLKATLSIGDSDDKAWISPGGNNNHLTLATTGYHGVLRFCTRGGSTGNLATGESMRIDIKGNVGIGVSTPKRKLHVGGAALMEKLSLGEYSSSLYPIRLEVFGDINTNGRVFASCGMLTCSDARYKKDVKPIENALERVTQLKGVNFRWKDESMGKDQQLGVIGQEVEKVFPEVVSTDSDGYKSVAYSQLVAPLIEAIKELKTENETLKVRIKALESKLKDY